MTRRTLAVVALTLVATAVFAIAVAPATCQATRAKITAISRSHAKVGAQVTIRGSYFGSRQGGSTVTFGERRNVLGFAPCSRKARVIRWSKSSITVRVPGMSPGKAGAPGTYHPVYVTVGGRPSNRVSFFIEPASVNPVISVAGQVNSQGEAATITRTANARGGYDYVTDSTVGVSHAGNMSNVLFENCTFAATCQTINGQKSGVVRLGGLRNSQERITFLGCTFNNNMGQGSGPDYGVNAVKVTCGWNGDDKVNDVSFVNCDFGTRSGGASTHGRMGYEAVNGNYGPAQRVLFRGCTFEPVDGEPFSVNDGDLYLLVDGCTFKGGTNTAVPEYGGTIETNQGHYIEIRNSDIWRWNGPAFNFTADGEESHILLKNLDIDFTHTYQTQAPTPSSGVFAWTGIRGARVAGCTINTGTASSCLNRAGSAYNASSYWATCTGNDLSGSTITGYIRMDGAAHIPATGRLYWAEDADEHNIWPTAVR